MVVWILLLLAVGRLEAAVIWVVVGGFADCVSVGVVVEREENFVVVDFSWLMWRFQW